VVAATEGWPAAVQVFARAARDGTIEALLHDADGVATADLHAYLRDEILSRVDDDDIEVIALVCAVPGVSSDEIARWYRREFEDVRAIVRDLPLISLRNGGWYPHPLLQAHVERRYRDRREAAMRTAHGELVASGQHARAARAALDAGETDLAARTLDPGVFLASTPSAEAADVIASIDAERLLRFPGLWNATGIYRVATMDGERWRAEAEYVWSSLPADAEPSVIIGVAHNVLNALSNAGRWEEFERFLDVSLNERLDAAGVRHDDPQRALTRTMAEGWSGVIRLRALDVNLFLEQIRPNLAAEYVRALVLDDVVARVRTYEGDHAKQQHALREAVVLARRSGVPSVIGIVLKDAALYSWLLGDDAAFGDYRRAIEEFADRTPSARAGVRHFLDCVRGDALEAQYGPEKPQIRPLCLLVGAAGARTRTERDMLLDAAVREADATRHPFPMTVARIACAGVSRDARERLAQARAIASEGAWPAWAPDDLEDPGRYAPWRSLVERFRSPAVAPWTHAVSAAEAVAPPTVLLASGELSRAGATAPLTPRERDIIGAIVAFGRPIPRETLLDAIWPGIEPFDAAAALRVALHRLRRRFGDATYIRNVGNSLALHHSVRVDLLEVEAAVRAPAPDEALLATFVDRVRRSGVVRGDNEWADGIARRIQAAVRGAVERLRASASSRGDGPAAIELAEALVALDPLDEGAAAALVRAWHAVGDHAAEGRVYDACAARLAADLDCEPGAELRRARAECEMHAARDLQPPMAS